MKIFKQLCVLLSITVLLSACATQHAQVASPVAFKQVQPQYVAVKNGRIEYYHFGHGTPLILIAGYGTDVTSWNVDFLNVLAQKHEVILPNNRDVAGTQIHSGPYTMSDVANDYYHLIQSLHLHQPAVLGISMGGMIAQQLAINHQNSLGALILVNTAIAGKQGVHPSPEVEQALRNLPSTNLGMYNEALKLFYPPASRRAMSVSMIRDRFLPASYTTIDRSLVMPEHKRMVEKWLARDDVAKQLKTLHLPVLVLSGTEDIAIPPGNSLALAKTIPNAHLIHWRQGGHGMLHQFPVAIANAINAFLVHA